MGKKIIPVLMTIISFFVLFPLVFIIIASFKGSLETTQYLLPLLEGNAGYISTNILPMYPTLQSYVEILIDTPEYMVLLWNTIINTILILMGQIVIAVPAAWGITRLNKHLKSGIILFYTILMILPFVIMMLPQYIVLNKLSLLNTRWAIVLPSIFSPFSVFMLYHYFEGISDTIIEQARIDGASNMDIFFRIVIPVGKPSIIATCFLGFIEAWNMIEQPIIFIKNQQLWPVTLFGANITSQNMGIIFTASVITMIPAACIFYIGYEYLEQGFLEVVDKE